ncbi:MAG TPA: hypothetical protein DCP55_05980 [Chitinophagaceae bacterium]|jgi:hypothetical protein|nr:hypothetical protein [Chitinophagaceae bacterium]
MIIEDVSVDFEFNGKKYTAYGNAEIDTITEDIGPVGYREHYYAEVVNNVIMSKIEISTDTEDIKNPDKDLLEKADDALCCQAEEDFDAGR